MAIGVMFANLAIENGAPHCMIIKDFMDNHTRITFNHFSIHKHHPLDTVILDSHLDNMGNWIIIWIIIHMDIITHIGVSYMDNCTYNHIISCR